MKKLLKRVVTVILSSIMVFSAFCCVSYADVPTPQQMADRIKNAKSKWSENSTYYEYVCPGCGYKAM